MMQSRGRMLLILPVFLLIVMRAGVPRAETPGVPGRANATIDYYVANTGDDANPGTLALPWRTVQHAADSVTAGSTVFLRGGLYNEVVTVAVSGDANAGYITFESYPGETAVLDGTGLEVPDGSSGLIFIRDHSYIAIVGLELRNYRSAIPDRVPVGIHVRGASHHIRIVDNHIHHIESNAPVDHQLLGADAHGIAFYGDRAPESIHDIEVRGNDLHDLRLGSSEALVFNGNVERFIVAENQVHQVDNIAIVMIGYEQTAPSSTHDRARDGLVQGNSVWDVDSLNNPAYGGERSADGIYADGGTRINIVGNHVQRSNVGIEVASEHRGRDASYINVVGNVVRDSHVVGIAMGGYANDRGSAHHNLIAYNLLINNDSDKTYSGELLLQYDTHHNLVFGNVLSANAQSLLVSNPFLANHDNWVDYNGYQAPSGAAASNWSWRGVDYQGFGAYQSGSGNDAHSRFVEEGDVYALGSVLQLAGWSIQRP